MKLYIYFSTLLLLGTTAWADPPAKHNLEFKESQKVILSVDDDGVSTTDLHLNSKDDSVFFLNQSSNSLLSLEINFGKKRLHCWSQNLDVADGVMKTIEPLSPRDFAVLCFPEVGQYPFKIKGLATKEEITGKVTVQ